MEHDIPKTWEAILEGCQESIVKQCVEVLVAEGLDPQDAATLNELTPELLNALRLHDPVACDRVLEYARLRQATISGYSKDETRANTSVSAPIACLNVQDHCLEPPDGKRLVPVCVDPFERRSFEQKDRRGTQAQEVVRGVFLGGFKAAENFHEHRRLGITHIINATAHRLDAPHAKVLCLNLRDADGDQDISCEFPRVIEFMDEAIAGGGACLVHCIRGVSRSSALVCAYIIARSNLSVEETLTLVQDARPIAKPRPGFMQQLKRFRQESNVLRKESSDARDTQFGKQEPNRRWKTPKNTRTRNETKDPQ